jgi:hypothetical protein
MDVWYSIGLAVAGYLVLFVALAVHSEKTSME